MFSILVKKIIITDGNSFNDLLEDKGKEQSKIKLSVETISLGV